MSDWEMDNEFLDINNEMLDVSESELSEKNSDMLEIPEDTEIEEEQLMDSEEVTEIPEDTDDEQKTLFTEEEIQENIRRTPINNGEWSGERGETLWIPADDKVQELLERYEVGGIEYTDGIPDFSKLSAFEYNLNEDELKEKNSVQFQSCNDGLSDYFSDLADIYTGEECDDPLKNAEYKEILKDTFKCDESEINNIQIALEQREKPEGYTWHHAEREGVMQLVKTEIHNSGRHRGGQVIWSGGNENR